MRLGGASPTGANRPIDGLPSAIVIARSRPGRQLVLPALIGGAWLLIAVGQVTGNAALVHDHGSAVIAGAAPLGTWATFMAAWLVMVVATMLPASLPSVRAIGRAAAPTAGLISGAAAFAATLVGVWVVFGSAVFVAEAALRQVAAASPWLGARPWLIDAVIVGLAGAYQFLPLKRRSLAACRHPAAAGEPAATTPAAFPAGLRHGFACVGSSGILMVVMVATGLGGLWWMAALTGVVFYETTGRHGRTAASAVGLLLLWLAVLIALPGWLPA
ncbi:MAG: DUF2182 domain-containing protein [Candidatus Limnocylindrales bacterium]